jgi:pyruvate carboxylase
MTTDFIKVNPEYIKKIKELHKNKVISKEVLDVLNDFVINTEPKLKSGRKRKYHSDEERKEANREYARNHYRQHREEILKKRKEQYLSRKQK